MEKDKDQSKPQRKLRPLAPGPLPAAEPSNNLSTNPQAIDEDLVMVPAPAPEAFVRSKNAPQLLKGPSYKSMTFRRTVVPLLLTYGLMLPTLGVLWFTTEPDSPFRNMGVALPIVLIVVGIVLLIFGVLNVLQLKRVISR